MTKRKHITWHNHQVKKPHRAAQKNQKPCVLWFTGLSGSGKSTIAGALEARLYELGCHTYLLDGDNVRYGLNKDLGFSDEDRAENIRRIGEMSALFVDAGLIVLSAFISPFRSDREAVRSLVAEGEFIEVFMDTPLAECEKRDPKGLYAKMRKGEIKQFTGVDSIYEPPVSPEVAVKTTMTIEESVDMIISALVERGVVPGA